jgi:hypothetical protein
VNIFSTLLIDRFGNWATYIYRLSDLRASEEEKQKEITTSFMCRESSITCSISWKKTGHSFCLLLSCYHLSSQEMSIFRGKSLGEKGAQ